MLARTASIDAVRGSARMNGCTILGKRLAEKKTPERIHIGSIVRFIKPETACIVFARDAIRSPIAEKVREARTHNKASCQKEPLAGTPKAKCENPRNAPTSITSSRSLQKRNEARYCQRGIGDAMSRLSSFFCRASTIEKPSAHIAELIRFMPSRPGITKSIYRDPAS